MEIVISVIVGAVIAAGVVFFVLRERKREPAQENQSLLLIQQQLQNLTSALDAKLGEAGKEMREAVRTQFSESAKIIRDVTERLTKLDETNRQVMGFADQLQSLQDILQNPKRRGVLGEYYLETVLKNVLPPSAFKLQFSFSDGLIVDAVILIQEKVIPIDSKFSLENYNRLVEERDPVERERLEKTFKGDLKNRIDETARYVRPGEGTLNFALMFVPSEAIYYDLIINKVGAVKVNTEELIQYAARKRVYIVSPNTFYAFLQIIIQGLKQFEIEKNTQKMLGEIEKLGKHLSAYEEFYRKLGSSLKTTVSHYNIGYKELGKIDKDILKITGESVGMIPEITDKPMLETE